jgi:hypothetical protein
LLEVELSEAAKSAQIDKKGFDERSAALLKTKETLEKIIHTAQQAPRVNTSVIELPVLSDCSRLEQNIIRETLVDANTYLEKIAEDAEKLLRVSKRAQERQLGWIRMIFHFSWLRARLSWLDRNLEVSRRSRKVLEDFIRTVSGTSEKDRHHESVLSVFSEFEEATSRVAKLRSRLQVEEAVNRDQKAWLDRYEYRRKCNIKSEQPPPPGDLIQSGKEFSSYLNDGSDLVGQRLTIARKLVSSLTGQPAKKDIKTSKENYSGNNSGFKGKQNRNKYGSAL